MLARPRLAAASLSFAFSLGALCAQQAASSPTLADRFSELDAKFRSAVAGKPASEVEAWTCGDSGRRMTLQWVLLSRLGAEGRARPALSQSTTLDWLLATQPALEELLGSGEVVERRWADALAVLDRIVTSDPAAKEGLPRRIAIATALTFAQPVAWMADGSPIDPVARYRSYVQWDRDGVLFPSFRDLSTWELRYVVGSWSSDADLVWAREHIKPELKVRDRVGDGAHMLKYTATNKNGVSVQKGRAFYDDKPMTMAVMLEYGGVCGAISRFGTSMSQAFGVPAMPVGQPGHCAFLWQKQAHEWSINNNISGWPESHRHDGIQMTWGNQAWLVPLFQTAQKDLGAFVDAELLLATAPLQSPSEAESLLAAARRRCPQHFGVWGASVLALQARAAGKAEWQAMLALAAKDLAQFPLAYEALLVKAEPFLLGKHATQEARQEYLFATTQVVAGMVMHGADARSGGFAVSNVLARMCQGNELAPVDSVELGLRVANSLEAKAKEPLFGAWRAALEELAERAIRAKETRAIAYSKLQEVCSRLREQKRDRDARWLADRIVNACKQAKDADLEAKAVAFRKSLG